MAMLRDMYVLTLKIYFKIKKMKQLLYTIACSFIAISAFSQKNFKQIDFSEVKISKGHPSLLDYGNPNVKSNLTVDVTKSPGTININAKDSVVTVKMDGSADKVFKILYIADEEKHKFNKKTYRSLSISCKNKTGVDFTLIISRDDNGKKMNIMNVSILQSNGDGDEYTCTYLKDLSEN